MDALTFVTRVRPEPACDGDAVAVCAASSPVTAAIAATVLPRMEALRCMVNPPVV